MKMTGLSLENWMCHPRLELKVTPLSLICGPNNRGKSAIADAVSFVLTSDLRRVATKGERGELIREGAESGKVTAKFGETLIGRDVKTGKLGPAGKPPSEATSGACLPYLMDTALFAAQPADVRRVALLKMMGVAIDSAAIFAELKARGRNLKLMGSTFKVGDPIEKFHELASTALKEARGVWKGITGEAYGSVKAVEWAAVEPEPVEEGAVAAAAAACYSATDDIEAHTRTLGRIEQAASDAGTAPNTARRDGLMQQARLADSAAEHLEDKLAAAEEAQIALEMLDATLLDVRNRQPGKAPASCPHCGADVIFQEGALEPYFPPSNPATPAELRTAIDARTAGYEALGEAKRAVFRAEGAVEVAQNATKLLDAGEGLGDPAIAQKAGSVLPLRADVEAQLAASRKELEAANAQQAALIKQVEDIAAAKALTEKAQAAHQKVVQWGLIVDDLAPTGIPTDFLAKALTPMNDKLRDLAAVFGWPQARVMDDMRITIDGRNYPMWAESVRWRADAMMAIAIADITKLRIVVIDRFDVLEVSARNPAMVALYGLTRTGPAKPLDTCILIGTLKAPPKAPPDVQVTWLGDAPAAMKAAA